MPSAVKRSGHPSHPLIREGFAVLRGFLNTALVAKLRRAVELALRGPPVPGCERPHGRLEPFRWNDAMVDLILRGTDRRRAVIEGTDASDLRWISGYISSKAPHTPALWWHQDWWCWDHPVSTHPAPAQVALLCYLTETTRDSGALRVLPGSHHASVPLHASLEKAHAKGERLPLADAAFRDQAGQVTLTASAGDAVVLDYRLLHATHPNASDERRDCVLLSFTPNWRQLPKDIRAHLIQHLALPREDEQASSAWCAELLPTFSGQRADLNLNRSPPATFAVDR
jgi:hypothetical protein